MPIRNIEHIIASSIDKIYSADLEDPIQETTNFAVDGEASAHIYKWENTQSYDIFINALQLWIGSSNLHLKEGFFFKTSALTNGLKLSYSLDGTTENTLKTFTDTKSLIMFAGHKNVQVYSTSEHAAFISIFIPETLFRRHIEGKSDTFIKLTVQDNLSKLEYGYMRVLGAKS